MPLTKKRLRDLSEKGDIIMREILAYSPEERELFRITNEIGDSIRTDEETLMTVIVLINTSQKLKKLKEWVN